MLFLLLVVCCLSANFAGKYTIFTDSVKVQLSEPCEEESGPEEKGPQQEKESDKYFSELSGINTSSHLLKKPDIGHQEKLWSLFCGESPTPPPELIF